MDFSVRSVQPEQIRTGCLVVSALDGRSLSPAAKAVDQAAKGSISKALRDGDLGSDAGSTVLLRDLEGIRAPRVLVVRMGAVKDLNQARMRESVNNAMKALGRTGAKDAVICVSIFDLEHRGPHWMARNIVEAAREADYRFTQMKGKPGPDPTLRKVTLGLVGANRRATQQAQSGLAEGVAVANGKDFAKDLGNLPGNHCTPSYLAAQARALAREARKLKVKVLEEADMRKLGMGALLSVSRGSRQPAKLIVVEYSGGRADRRPVVLVGKGVTFDSGGISIKPAAAMDEMKFDMCGAASVLGAIKAAAELGLGVNVVGLIPATENLPDGDASKPGDIVKSMAGLTIEVLNTDAEGRLILCDALTYAARYEPDVIIDVATLTGACVVALGHHPTGLFTNHAPLGRALIEGGSQAGDKAWELPVWEEFHEQLKSNFADVANVGGRDGGAITAACFLSRFTEDYRWAHLDIAGTAWHSGGKKGATGRPVPLLVQYLIDHSGANAQRKKRV